MTLKYIYKFNYKYFIFMYIRLRAVLVEKF